MKNFLIFWITLISCLISTELILRCLGYKPYNIIFFENAKVLNKGKLSTFIPDELLGFKPRPGIKIESAEYDTNSIRYVVDSSFCRITSYHKNNFEKQLIIDGCSFTFGDNLDDTQTSSFLLQQKLIPYKINVKNISCGGYGTAQFYLQVKNLDNSKNNILAFILNYASFHDARAILARSWRSVLVYAQESEISLPYATLRNDSAVIAYKLLEYSPMPLQGKSALVNRIDAFMNTMEEKNASLMSRKLIEQMADICKQKNILFILAGLENDVSTNKIIDYCRSKGICTMQYNIDLGNPRYNFLPYDNHPNAMAHTIFADSLYSKLMQLNLIFNP